MSLRCGGDCRRMRARGLPFMRQVSPGLVGSRRQGGGSPDVVLTHWGRVVLTSIRSPHRRSRICVVFRLDGGSCFKALSPMVGALARRGRVRIYTCFGAGDMPRNLLRQGSGSHLKSPAGACCLGLTALGAAAAGSALPVAALGVASAGAWLLRSGFSRRLRFGVEHLGLAGWRGAPGKR